MLIPKLYYQRWRLIKDALIRQTVVAGGLAIIGAIVLIFFYLLYAVFPLFLPAQTQAVTDYALPEKTLGKTVLLAMEEQNKIAVRFTDQGVAIFFEVDSGKIVERKKLPLPPNSRVVSFAQGDFANGIVAYGLSNGKVIVARHRYEVSYPLNVRVITPEIDYPLGQSALILDPKAQPLTHLAFKSNDEQSTFVAQTADGRMLLVNFKAKKSIFAEEASLERSDAHLGLTIDDAAYLLIDKEQTKLYTASQNGLLRLFDIRLKDKPVFKQNLNLLTVAGSQLSSMVFLNGDLSLLVGDSLGEIAQWSVIRDEHNQSAMQKLRSFKLSEQPIVAIYPEALRKGFIAIDRQGQLGIYHTTAQRELDNRRVIDVAPQALALSPRANGFLIEGSDGKIHYWQVHNEHPEISVKSLWQKVWYESYSKPDYVWQSSSASNDFEPKMSLTPLVFGTMKAAFYAMLVATPFALMGAVYTAYFMAPLMRQYVKPGIELMGALPTVILGFLAGLWLAPFIELHLSFLFSLLMIVPLTVILFAYGWQFVPKFIRQKIPEGWDAAVLMPVILIGFWFAWMLSFPIENLCFNGNLRVWFMNEWGIGYDQRNALVVGLAMGFAVIPTIFSIAEDAIFSVPKHLTIGSLALGATPWQTMTRVVLLTASPGIFSAIMIGLGRAIGETMIVLMATGNTPVMDLSVFQGMRTLSANIGVEMPESEVDSTHYRVLFLAALVLFLFTFVFNTLAEVVRQRLRQKYSSL
jgi:phosphate transport system permease protein